MLSFKVVFVSSLPRAISVGRTVEEFDVEEGVVSAGHPVPVRCQHDAPDGVAARTHDHHSLTGLDVAHDVVQVQVFGLIEIVGGRVQALLLEDFVDPLEGEVAVPLQPVVAVDQRGTAPLVVTEQGEHHLAHLGVRGRHAREV